MVYRVYNGSLGNGCIHRIVEAASAVEAVEKTRGIWPSFGKIEAEPVVLDVNGVETEDQDV